MIGLNNEFQFSTLQNWIDQLTNDLKGEDFSLLLRDDKVEEIHYTTFQHHDSTPINPQSPGYFPFTRGVNTKSNDWSNGFLLNVRSEKEANTKALESLMKGCDLLVFDLSLVSDIKFDVLFEGIQFDYIKAQIKLSNARQFNSLKLYFNDAIPATICFNQDSYNLNADTELFQAIVAETRKKQRFSFTVNGFGVQQAGATSWQEIAYCLSQGNDVLGLLLENGFTVDQAAACIHFTIGIGSNYFFEIAKIRALKQNWATIVKAYAPNFTCSHNCVITAHIGFMNKSLKDPHTNLLRQTTETMAAAAGGVDAILVHPYDASSQNGSSSLSERMALNFSLILKEESYFNQVIDPLGGSYAVEDLTTKIAEKSWTLFQTLEQGGGLSMIETKKAFIDQIKEKAALRLTEIKTTSKLLIGINKFPNPQEVKENLFIPQTCAFGLEPIHFETELNTLV